MVVGEGRGWGWELEGVKRGGRGFVGLDLGWRV